MNDNKALGFKRTALRKVIEFFDAGKLQTHAFRIPFDVIPQDANPDVRCCIYKERAVFRERTIAALGGALENDDESTSLNDYAKQALTRQQTPSVPVTVLDIACKGCLRAHHFVTEACQGCLARTCQTACKFGAVSITKGKGHIDPNKCKNCGQCRAACPYNAIIYIPVPCEQACPVDAIRKTEDGLAQIDPEKCISCGHCMDACPFGAITERSQLIDVLREMKKSDKVCAIVAPSIAGQFQSATLAQLITALKQAGFDKVTEVAQGADITTTNEAKELLQRLQRGDTFMTTSCCSAWTEAVKKHIPEMQKHVSATRTPMSYTAEMEKKNGYTVVFIGPCVAKRVEGLQDPNVDYVLTFEELSALLEARHINPAACTAAKLAPGISAQGRYYGVTGGVAKAVETAVNGKRAIKLQTIAGLDKKAMLILKAHAKGFGNNFQLLEVMSCKGGCIGGPCTNCSQAKAIKPIEQLVANSPHIPPVFKKEN